MPKYPREQQGLFGLDSTAFLWAIIGATLLAGGFFLFGMYYGYQQGYEAARQSLSDEEPSRRASARSGEKSESNSSRQQSRQGTDSERQAPAITADQLSGTDGTETPDADGSVSGESQEENRRSSPRAGVYGSPTAPDADRTQESQSSRTGDTSASDQRTTDETSQESSSSPEERPQALSVTRFDTDDEETTDQTADDASASGEQSQPDTETDETPATDTGEESDEASRSIDAEGPVYTIQAVSFLKESRAEREVENLESKGYEASITEKVINDQRYFRVRVGSFVDRTEADNAAQEMVEKGDINDYWISRVEN